LFVALLSAIDIGHSKSNINCDHLSRSNWFLAHLRILHASSHDNSNIYGNLQTQLKP
jgi:hypothetical protein